MSGFDLQAVREQLPSAWGRELYLNLGGAGPLPRVAVEAAHRSLDRSLHHGRATLDTVDAMSEQAARLRSAVGRLLGTTAVGVGLSTNTTQGINSALWGLRWRPGDRVVTTALEHPGVTVPLGVLERRFGVELTVLGAEACMDDLGAAVDGAVCARTRMVVVSHVAWGTGAHLDVAGAARAAHRVGALCVVDGAQSAGAIDVDVESLGVDAYALPAHKWLCGPEGLGALWVSRSAVAQIDLSSSGYESGHDHTFDGGVVPHLGGRRFEISTPPMDLLAAWEASLEWQERLGRALLHRRIREGAAAARGALEAIEGVRVLTPPGPQAGLVSFTVDGWDHIAACTRLADEGVLVRWLPYPAALRASIGFHWHSDDIERLAGAVRGLLGGLSC